jgi:hypothetical protein
LQSGTADCNLSTIALPLGYFRLPCSFVAAALLGSYAVQSEIGDYTEAHGTGFEYISKMQFTKSQNAELLEKIAELHRTHQLADDSICTFNCSSFILCFDLHFIAQFCYSYFESRAFT